MMASEARISVILLFSFIILAKPIKCCHRVYFDDPDQDNIACQCNTTHCDSLQFEWPRDDRIYLQVQSTKRGDRFKVSQLSNPATTSENLHSSSSLEREADYLVRVEINKRRQQVLGFGGAFTDSASQVIGLLQEPLQQRALEDYFGPYGLRYNLGRVPIAGTDMSTRPYSYNDLPVGQLEDLELKYFRLQPEDLIFKIPLIRRVNKMRLPKEPLKLVAASWSAPAWMKSNRHLVQGRLLGNSSQGSPFYDAYARYVIRFLQEYRSRNITMWALSPQNEPHTPKRIGPKMINFNSNNFEPEEMANYLERSLIPALVNYAASLPDDRCKLLIWDDTIDGLAKYQFEALKSASIKQHLDGLALHWYSQGLRETPYDQLYEIRRQLPSRYFMISTEASFIGQPQPGKWERGQRYARDIIENLKSGSVGWIDWNLALNTSGGPTWSNNLLDSSMLVDLSKQVYYKNPMYYAIGHVSRFIEPGSHILSSELISLSKDNNNQSSSNVTLVAAELEPGEEPPIRAFRKATTGTAAELRRRVALVALNRAPASCSIRLELIECKAKEGQRGLTLELPANSITSLAFLC